MDDSKKVLAVSYGNFSCHLEGFDDSVETMKTVVTFFHELAGHSRFMDMEPQAPDLETLAELTQEQTGQQVEIAGEGQHVSLRVTDNVAEEDAADDYAMGDPFDRLAGLTNPDVGTERSPLRIQRPEPVEDTDDEDEPVEVSLDADADEAATEEEADETDTEFEDTAEDDEEAVMAESDVEEDVDAEDFAGDDETVAEDDTTEEEEVEEDVASETDGQDVAEDDEEIAETHDDAEAEDENEDDDDGDDVASKLQRIRAVVGRGHPETPASDKPLKGDNSFANKLRADILGQVAANEDEEVSNEEDVTAADEDSASDDVVDDFQFTGDASEEPAEDVAETAEAEDLEDDGDEPSPIMDDDELHREVEEVSREIAERRANRSKRDELPENDYEETSRILSNAEIKMNDTEGKRQREAFSQMRAAVAAKQAAEQLGDENTSDPTQAFREDLEDAVHSDIADHDAELELETEAETTAEEESTEAAPLKLVASQRVDGKPVDEASRRLNQIAAMKKSTTTKKRGFTEFAADMGASELGDLLEAAAAYITHIEGEDDFSRPQVMKKAQEAAPTEFSREDGLRAFGRLLRTNHLNKLDNGRFRVAENSRFRPQDRAS